MIVWQLFRWLLLAAEVWIAFPILYLCLLSASAMVATMQRNAAAGRQSAASSSARFSFAVLIPAHNEERVLGALLNSLSMLAYPKERYVVCVVADNCTDHTAHLARAVEQVRVYERFDQNRRGKGYALNWLIGQLEADLLRPDAYVILDADSVVEPAFLQALERELARGAQALQAYNGVLNTVASPSTALRWIALALVNHVRLLGRNGLGMSASLTGNGICLRRSLLMRHPWQAFGTAEDYQYYLTLIEHGVRVRYVPEAVVRSIMPITFSQMRTQDIRWEAAVDIQPTWRVVLKLLDLGIRHRDLARIEAAAEVLTPPLSFLASWCVIALAASLVLFWPPGLLLSLALIGGLACYISTAFYLLRPPPAVYRGLLHVPGFIVWKLWVYFVLRKRSSHTSEWVRTSRTIS